MCAEKYDDVYKRDDVLQNLLFTSNSSPKPLLILFIEMRK